MDDVRPAGGRVRRACTGPAFGRLARVRVRADLRPARAGRHVKGSAMKSEASVLFVVGKLGKNDKRMMVLDDKTPPPIPGPFELRAVFSR